MTKRQEWFITDMHLGHKMLVERGYRPLNYEQEIYRNWAKDVKHDDVVINLGDVAFGHSQRDLAAINKALPGRKILIKGNHDENSDNWYLDRGFDFVCDSLTLRRYGLLWLFSHYPRRMGEFNINVHGHLHDGKHRLGDKIDSPRHKLLSLELHGYGPKSFKWLYEKFAEKEYPGMAGEHHIMEASHV